jgi:UDP-2,3-diacylglucosamine hydrolase
LSDTVYFLSDAHFKYDASDPRERDKRDRFRSFLESISGCPRLYLVGDIFDFWFEYRSVIPRYYQDVLDPLGRLVAGGTSVYIMGGNHDHWFGSFLKDSLGITVLEQPAVHEIQGRRVMLTHGDDLLPGDYGYRMLKSLIRSRPVIALAKLFHPDLLFAFASSFSRTSKGLTHGRTKACADRLSEMAFSHFFKDNNDAFIMGHVHLPRILESGERTFIILGDWETHFSYARLEGGIFTLENYRSGDRTGDTDSFQRDGDTVSENR